MAGITGSNQFQSVKESDRLEALRVVARIRKMLAEGRTYKQIEQRTGWSVCRIYHVKKGKTYKQKPVTLNDLQLSKSDKLCRRCGNPAGYVSIACGLICVSCAVTEVINQGALQLDKP